MNPEVLINFTWTVLCLWMAILAMVLVAVTVCGASILAYQALVDLREWRIKRRRDGRDPRLN